MKTAKIISLILTVAMLCCAVCTLPFTVSAADSGKCGDNLTWTLDESGTLTVSGTGKMTDYGFSNQPWAKQSDKIISVKIDSGVTGIGVYAFVNCDVMTSITIPDSVTVIGDWAFAWCHSLTGVTIPDSVTSIGPRTFFACHWLEKIQVDENNPNYTSVDGVLYSKDKKQLLCFPRGKKDAEILDGVTSIGVSAFGWNELLTSITIPDSVTRIEDSAFDYCRSLTSITIPNSVTYIGPSAFFNCGSLTSITILNSATYIANSAFTGCSSLTIYGNVGSYAQKYATENDIPFISLGTQIGDKYFIDVVPGEWYVSAVQYAVEHSLFNGTGDHTFEPNTAMTRAMLVKVLYNLEGKPDISEYNNPFSDVAEGEWYTGAVKWAAANGVVYGTGDTAFSPNDKITREQLSAILYRYSELKGYDISGTAELNAFPDGDDISSYAKEAISWAVGVGLITGNKIGSVVMLDAKGDATRAQVALILKRYATVNK